MLDSIVRTMVPSSSGVLLGWITRVGQDLPSGATGPSGSVLIAAAARSGTAPTACIESVDGPGEVMSRSGPSVCS